MSIEALNASIAKWERNAVAATPEEYKTRAEDCPLCGLYLNRHATAPCVDCPIYKVTGKDSCSETPYCRAVSTKWWWEGEIEDPGDPDTAIGLRDNAHEAARKEVEFLKEVRAKVYPEYKTSTEEK